jgi:Bax protein
MLILALSGLHGQAKLTIEQEAFVDLIVPVVEQVNAEIAEKRKDIYTIQQKFRDSGTLDPSEKARIIHYLNHYRCDVPDDTTDFEITKAHFTELLRKADIIPLKLVLAQAALESNWGKSRFVKEGNNYFGIRCLSKGCGIAPRKAKSKFWVKSYPSLLDGVRDYMRLLNSSRYYKDFRNLRIVNRMNNQVPDPFYIVNGLENYSSRGKAYTRSLVTIMKSNFYYL